VRFADIQAAGIARSWTQLNRLIDDDGFPVGVMLSPNIRAWELAHVMAWLATRPTERKPVPDRSAGRRTLETAP
jgi:predicted DNA-binding transcriptional regulator AlpA